MNIRIAILAAFASTLAMSLADTAQANYSDTTNAKSLAKAAGIETEPMILVAQNAPINTSRSNIRRPSQKAGSGDGNSAMGEVSTTRGRVQKNNTGGLGNSGPAKAPINTNRSNIKRPGSGGALTDGMIILR